MNNTQIKEPTISELKEMIARMSLGLYYDETMERPSHYDLIHGKKDFGKLKDFTSQNSMPLPEAPDRPKDSGEPTQLLKDAGIQTLSGKTALKYKLPKLEPVSEDSKVGELVVQYTKRLVKGSFISADENHRTWTPSYAWLGSASGELFPVFTPEYTFTTYDKEMLNAAAQTSFKNNSSLFKNLCEIAKENAYTSGTKKGQVLRLKVVQEIATKAVEMRKLKNKHNFFRLRHKEQDAYLESFFQPLTCAIEFDALPSLINMRVFEKGGKPLTSVNMGADAGPIFHPLKRREVVPQEVELADMIVKKLESLKTPQSIVEWINDRKWMFLVFMKNKAEVYAEADFVKKTRNYFPVSQGVHLPAQMVFAATTKNWPNYQENKKSKSLLGFKFYRGGMEAFIQSLRNEKSMISLVYSDNLYIYDPVVDKFYSKDGSKMEGSTNLETSRIVCNFIRKRIPTISSGWDKYLVNLMPSLATENVAVWYNQLIPTPFLGSGSQGTVYYNTFMMAMATKHLHTLKKYPGDEAIEDIAAQSGVFLTHECEASLRDIPYGKVVQLDFLGYDIVRLDPAIYGFDAVFPILNYKRLLKACCFFKNDVGAKLSTAGKAAIKVIKAKSLFYLGGWFYKDMAEMLQGYVFRQLQTLNQKELRQNGTMSTIVNDIIANMDSITLDELGQLEALSRSPSQPSLYDVVELCGTPENLVSFVRRQKERYASGDITWDMLLKILPAPELMGVLDSDLIEFISNDSRFLKHADKVRSTKIQLTTVTGRDAINGNLIKDSKFPPVHTIAQPIADPMKDDIPDTPVKDVYLGYKPAKDENKPFIGNKFQNEFLNLFSKMLDGTFGAHTYPPVRLSVDSFKYMSNAVTSSLKGKPMAATAQSVVGYALLQIANALVIPVDLLKKYLQKPLFKAAKREEGNVMILPTKALEWYVIIAFIFTDQMEDVKPEENPLSFDIPAEFSLLLDYMKPRKKEIEDKMRKVKDVDQFADSVGELMETLNSWADEMEKGDNSYNSDLFIELDKIIDQAESDKK